MASTPDQTPGAVPVTDHRPSPAGVLPRRLQTWLMAGLAAGIVVIILLTGAPSPPTPTAAQPPSSLTGPAADRVRDYQDRLRAMEARAALEAASTAPPPEPMPSPEVAMRATTDDPTVTDRRRREYESLFASNVVLSRRAEGSRPLDGVVSPAPEVVGATATPLVPSLDAIANAVVRASARDAGGTIAAPALAPPRTTADDIPRPDSLETPAQTDPISAAGPMHRLLEGTFIDAVLANRLDGTEAAPVISLVTNPVFAHAGHVVVIPAGARVIGETRAVRTVDDTRLAVTFHRLVMPDGRTYRLEQTRGLNARGDAGLKDQVNRHYWATFGAAGAVGLISGLAQWLGTAGTPDDGDQTVVIGGMANTTSQSALQVMNRFLNRLPTVTIREGHRLKVYLARDLDLPAYANAAPNAARREGTR